MNKSRLLATSHLVATNRRSSQLRGFTNRDQNLLEHGERGIREPHFQARNLGDQHRGAVQGLEIAKVKVYAMPSSAGAVLPWACSHALRASSPTMPLRRTPRIGLSHRRASKNQLTACSAGIRPPFASPHAIRDRRRPAAAADDAIGRAKAAGVILVRSPPALTGA
jgi:hypothetical protein